MTGNTEPQTFFCYIDNTICIESNEPITETEVKERALSKLFEIIRKNAVNWHIEEE